jgi:probable F420-dependent oxidoreductase
MRLDVAFLNQDLRTMDAVASRVEAMGFAGLWVSEAQHDPYLPLAMAAARTRRIDLGTAIATVFSRSPMITAQLAWDLQHASAGRFVLGLGTQVKAHNERRFSVPFEAPGPKMREAILGIRAIWECWQNGTRLDFKGQYYRFDVMTPFFNPGPIAHPHVPIWIAGVNPYMCRLAGELCEGLHVHPLNSPTYLREVVLPAVEAGLAASGRKRNEITLFAPLLVVVGDSEAARAAARQVVRQQIAMYGSTRTYQRVLAAHGWQDLTLRLHEKSVRGDWDGMTALVTDEVVDTYAVTGTYATIGRAIRERYDGLLDRCALYHLVQPSLDDSRWPDILGAFRE